MSETVTGDGLDAFDAFTRRAARDGMFNDDQLDHMRYLSSLPPERLCGCGWYEQGDCYNCNLKELVRLGGRVEHPWTGSRLYLPDGREVDYSGIAAWLRANAEA